MQGMTRKPLPGGKSAQYVKDLGDTLPPTDIIFTQQTSENPWHQCPTTQFVVTLAGAWYVNTTDGGYVEMRKGDVLFQDDYKGLVVGGTTPNHYSGSIGGACNQMVVSLAKTAAAIQPKDKCEWVKRATMQMP